MKRNVYVLRNAAGNPLYVGNAEHVLPRLGGLRREPWWNQVRSITWTEVDAAVAGDVERHTIEELQPEHNKAGRTYAYSPAGIRHHEPGVFTVGQAADALKVSVSTVRRMIRNGHIQTVPHMGTLVRIPVAEVERLVKVPS